MTTVINIHKYICICLQKRKNDSIAITSHRLIMHLICNYVDNSPKYVIENDSNIFSKNSLVHLTKIFSL